MTKGQKINLKSKEEANDKGVEHPEPIQARGVALLDKRPNVLAPATLAVNHADWPI